MSVSAVNISSSHKAYLDILDRWVETRGFHANLRGNSMGHKVFISFKAEDEDYKTYIQNMEGLDFVDKSLNQPINSENEDYILRKIRSDYLSTSTVTILLIGLYGAENRGTYEQRYIKRELQGSLYDSDISPKSGILGVVLPGAKDYIFQGSYDCVTCGSSHRLVSINDGTTIKEFSYNYYIPNGKCSHTEEERYCVLVYWDDFVATPESYIDAAFDKRFDPIAKKTKVYL